MPRKYGILTLK